jgi:MFS-type transporter involved in bile tolerance (Atg22 family)
VFFTTPSIILPREAHAPGLAFLNTVAIAGSSLSPIIVGRLRDLTGGFSVPLLAVSGILLLGVITMLLVPRDVLSPKTAAREAAIA